MNKLFKASQYQKDMAILGNTGPIKPSHRDRCFYGKLARIKRTEARQRSGSQYARYHRGEPGRNGGPKGV